MSVRTDEFPQFFFFSIKYFPDRKRIMKGKGMLFQILQHLSDAGGMTYHHVCRTQTIGTIRLVIRKGQILLDIDDRIYPEAIYPFFCPPVNHLIEFPGHCRIIPVKIRLLLGKGMVIIKILPARHRLPHAAAEIGTVVRRRFSILSFPEIEIITIRTIRILQRFLKPFVLIRTVIKNQIHNKVHVPHFQSGHQFFKVFHGTEFRCDLIIIRNVISLIHKR